MKHTHHISLSTKHYLLVMLLVGVLHSYIGQSQITDVSIPFENLPDSAIVQGVFQIRLSAAFMQIQPNGDIAVEGQPFFGVPLLDSLCKVWGVIRYKKVISIPVGRVDFNPLPAENKVLRWVRLYVNNPKAVAGAVRSFNNAKPWVDMAEPVYKIDSHSAAPFSPEWLPNDTLFARQWHYHNTGQTGGRFDADIDLPEAWEIEKGNPAVIVAVMDNGIDTTHPDFKPNLWSGKGYNFYDEQASLVPANHGNHVAGVIGAVNNNIAFVAGIAGGDGSPSSGIRLMSCQTFSPSGLGSGFENAFVWSADMGAAICNNSWGYNSPGVYNQSVLDAIDYFIAKGGGTVLRNGLVFFSAGNGGDYAERWPGAYYKVIGVTATNQMDKKAWYATYSEKIDIAAPGGELNAYRGGPIENNGKGGILSTIPLTNGGVNYQQGTSMATPHAVGVAALIVSKGLNRLSADDVKSILLTTTDNIDQYNDIEVIGKLGAGRLNAFKALEATVAMVSAAPVAAPTNFLAIVNCVDVQISWQKNGDNNDVLLAFSSNFERGGLFGIPSGNLITGQSLVGGGTIIYKGPANGFNWNGLPDSSKFFLKIWSVTPDNRYSMGIVLEDCITTRQPVSNFRGNANCFQSATLKWDRPTSCPQRKVLLAFGLTNDFAQPQANAQAGEALGNGKVVYVGNDNQFIHQLPNLQDSTALFYTLFIWDNGQYRTSLSYELSTPAAISSFQVASNSATSINILWQKNACFTGNVIVAANNSQLFDTPQPTDQPGPQPTSGGQIIYNGDANTFLHGGLTPNLQMVYAIWPVLNNALGRPMYAFGTTLCTNTAIPLPYLDTISLASIGSCRLDTFSVNNNSSSATPLLSVVSKGQNPIANPFGGNYMLKFNSYETRETNQAVITTPKLSTEGLASVDVKFKWNEDGSDYTTFNYNEEGVSLFWSTDKLRWNPIDFIARKPMGGGNTWKYKQATLPLAAANQPALFIRFVFTSRWGFNCYLDEIEVAATKIKPSDGKFAVAKAQFTDSLSGYTKYYDANGYLLVDIKKEENNLGHIDDSLKVGVGGNSQSYLYVKGNHYTNNSGGWAIMGRYFLVNGWITPDKPLDVRFYFTATDRDQLLATALQLQPPVANLPPTQWTGYLIHQSPGNLLDINPALGQQPFRTANNFSSQGFWQLEHYKQADSLHWVYENPLPDFFAMRIKLAQMGGGGGLGIGSSKGNGAMDTRWLKLTASRQNNLTEIKWTTGYNGSINQFYVQRSSDSIHYSPIFILPVADSFAMSGSNYTALDTTQLTNGKYWYRINAFNALGNNWVSDTVAVSVVNVKGVRIFPQPIVQLVTFSSEFPMQSIRLFDAKGRILMQIKPESNTFKLPVYHLLPGCYFAEVYVQGKPQVLKLLKIQ